MKKFDPIGWNEKALIYIFYKTRHNDYDCIVTSIKEYKTNKEKYSKYAGSPIAIANENVAVYTREL